MISACAASFAASCLEQYFDQFQSRGLLCEAEAVQRLNDKMTGRIEVWKYISSHLALNDFKALIGACKALSQLRHEPAVVAAVFANTYGHGATEALIDHGIQSAVVYKLVLDRYPPTDVRMSRRVIEKVARFNNTTLLNRLLKRLFPDGFDGSSMVITSAIKDGRIEAFETLTNAWARNGGYDIGNAVKMAATGGSTRTIESLMEQHPQMRQCIKSDAILTAVTADRRDVLEWLFQQYGGPNAEEDAAIIVNAVVGGLRSLLQWYISQRHPGFCMPAQSFQSAVQYACTKYNADMLLMLLDLPDAAVNARHISDAIFAFIANECNFDLFQRVVEWAIARLADDSSQLIYVLGVALKHAVQSDFDVSSVDLILQQERAPAPDVLMQIISQSVSLREHTLAKLRAILLRLPFIASRPEFVELLGAEYCCTCLSNARHALRATCDQYSARTNKGRYSRSQIHRTKRLVEYLPTQLQDVMMKAIHAKNVLALKAFISVAKPSPESFNILMTAATAAEDESMVALLESRRVELAQQQALKAAVSAIDGTRADKLQD